MEKRIYEINQAAQNKISSKAFVTHCTHANHSLPTKS